MILSVEKLLLMPSLPPSPSSSTSRSFSLWLISLVCSCEFEYSLLDVLWSVRARLFVRAFVFVCVCVCMHKIHFSYPFVGTLAHGSYSSIVHIQSHFTFCQRLTSSTTLHKCSSPPFSVRFEMKFITKSRKPEAKEKLTHQTWDEQRGHTDKKENLRRI